jgi:hypothetical protein
MSKDDNDESKRLSRRNLLKAAARAAAQLVKERFLLD